MKTRHIIQVVFISLAISGCHLFKKDKGSESSQPSRVASEESVYIDKSGTYHDRIFQDAKFAKSDQFPMTLNSDVETNHAPAAAPTESRPTSHSNLDHLSQRVR